MGWVADQLKAPIDMFNHSDPIAEALTGNDITFNPDRSFRSGLSTQYDDDRIAQSLGIDKDRYMHVGEYAAGLAALFFGGEAAFGSGGGGAGAGVAAEGGGDAGAATAGGGIAEGGSAVVGDVGAADTVGATGTAGLGDAAAAGGGGDAGAAATSGGASAADSGFSLSGLAHKASTFLSLYNTAGTLINAKKAADAAAAARNQAGQAPPAPPQAPNDPDMSAIRKKNSLLFGDDSPSSTDLTEGKADQGSVGKVSLLGGTKKLGG